MEDKRLEIGKIISTKLSQWKKFGRILGLEERFLEGIEKEHLSCRESAEKVIDKYLETYNGERKWLMWKNCLSQVKDNGMLVIREMEDEYPMLLNNSDLDVLVPNDYLLYIGQPYLELTQKVLRAISSKLSDWKQFGKCLGLKESYLQQVEKDNHGCMQHAEKVINKFLETYKGEICWLLWKNYLSQFNDGKTVICEIEAEYPTLLNQYSYEEVQHTVKINGALYIGHPYFGITNKDESITIPDKKNTDICVRIGGENRIVHYQEFDEWKETKERYLKIYSSLNHLKAIDFYDGNKTRCQILGTLKEFLIANRDEGFATRGYNYIKHFNLFNKNKIPHKLLNESYVCVVAQDKTALFFTKCLKGIKNGMEESYKNISMANALHPQLKFLTQINVIIYDDKDNNPEKERCSHCNDNKLYVHEEVFQSIEKFKEWYGSFSNIQREETRPTEEALNVQQNIGKICQLLKKDMITYEALDTCFFPSFSRLPKTQLKELEKVLLLSPTQFEVLHSDEPFILLRGAYGSGKSFILCKKFESVVTREKDDDIFFIICNDQQSEFIHYLKLLRVLYPEKNIIVCKSDDFIGTFQSNKKLFVTSSPLPKLSAILNHIKNAWPDKTVHVFIDEFSAKYIDIGEVDMLEQLLHSFKNCAHLIVALQSMEEKLIETGDSRKDIGYEIDLLTQKTKFKLHNLDYSLRSSSEINTFVKETAAILESDVIFLSEAKNYIVKGVQVDNQLARELTDEKSGETLLHGNIFYNQGDDHGHSVSGENVDVYFIDKINIVETNDRYLLYRYTLEHIFEKLKSGDQEDEKVVIGTYDDDLYNAVYAMLYKLSHNWTSDVKKFINEDYHVLITDYGSVRGFEFTNFVYLLPFGKEYMRYRILQCLTRATMKLCIITDNLDLKEKSVDEKLIQRWETLGCVNFIPCKFDKVKKQFEVLDKNETKSREVEDVILGKVQKYPWSKKEAQEFQEVSYEKVAISDLSIGLRNLIGTDSIRLLFMYSQLHKLDMRAFRDENNNSLLHYAAERNAEEILKSLIDEYIIDINSVNDSNETPLHLGARYGSFRVVKHLIEKGANLFEKNEREETPLSCAIQNGYLDIVQLITNMYCDRQEVLLQGKNNFTPLHLAALDGQHEIVNFLLDNKALIDGKTKSWETPLHLAITNKHSEVAELLINRGASLNDPDKNLRTPFFLAANYGLLSIIRIMIKKYGKNKDFLSGGENNYTPLHGASFYGHFEVVKELLNLGAKVNAKTNSLYTPLHRAVQGKHLSVSKVLIEYGADVNCQNDQFDTPLHFSYNNASITDFLLKQQKINIHLRRISGDMPIHVACERGDFQVTRLLIEKGAEIGAHGKELCTPLFNAAFKGHKDIVQLLIENKANINTRSRNLMTPLFVAARHGYKKIVQLLVNLRANQGLPDDRGRYPLHEAVSNKHEEIVKILVENFADVNATDEDQITPLYMAAYYGVFNIVKLLLENNARVDSVETKYGNTPLYTATYQGHRKIVQLLLDYGATVNLANNSLNSPLCRACHNGDLDIIKDLVEKGANINHLNEKFASPLHIAAYRGYEEIVGILLDKNADVNSLNEQQAIPLDGAALYGHLNIVKALVKYGSEINSASEFGFTPLHQAANNGHIDVVRFLLNQNFKNVFVNIRSSKDGRTPLYLATFKNNEQITQLLLENGADANIAAKNKRTPLHNVAFDGQAVIAASLIQKGANVDAFDDFKRTPLHTAAYSGNVDVARMLIKCGATIDVLDKFNNTPLHSASFRGNKNMVQLLLANGANVNSSVQTAISLNQKSVGKMHRTPLHSSVNRTPLHSSVNKTPLHSAVNSGNERVARILIENGANVNAVDMDKNTPLHIAAFTGSENIVRLLIDKGAIVNLRSINENTPLHSASFNGCRNIANLLIENGAKVNCKNIYNEKPLTVAIRKNHVGLIELLERFDSWRA